ncbi:hypothetical protein ABZV61_39485 [Streptomyces sp900116325]|uniref:Adenylate kinase n=1 Tax=Streptomyces sp. 900116325 TaxID=3154295 RepID=A0ABV2ULG9_9ACTN
MAGPAQQAARTGPAIPELDQPHTDLDDLLFTPDGPLPLEEFRRQAGEITRTDGWIVEGNFSKLADVVWHRADTLVWLDFPLPLILYRVVRRSLRQLAGRDDSAQARSLTATMSAGGPD